MVTRTKWIDRKFNFDFPVGLFPCILGRLQGTAARLEEIIRSLPPDILTRQPEHGWSIQENVGHLIKVEELHTGRLDDYDAGAEVLRPADMKNTRTSDADYNSQDINSVLAQFRAVRQDLLSRLENMDEAEASRVAQHPRLDIPMRVVDMAYFVAEHDDFHVAVITELAGTFEAE
ncbi:MAG: DinB family protein [Candidatus Zixiibacteriota bacterium]|nr:MAG: DinB family protein [candidate division Zixibacteria bacterium]